MRFVLLAILLTLISNVSFAAVIRGEDVVLRTSLSEKFCSQALPGSVCRMTYKDANQYCASVGSRLPTAREFADYSVKHGEGGVRDTQFPGLRMDDPQVAKEIEEARAEFYRAILIQNDNGDLSVAFYLYNSLYTPENVLVENNYFWTSTLYLGSGMVQHYQRFEGKGGGFDYGWHQDDLNAVICAGEANVALVHLTQTAPVVP